MMMMTVLLIPHLHDFHSFLVSSDICILGFVLCFERRGIRTGSSMNGMSKEKNASTRGFSRNTLLLNVKKTDYFRRCSVAAAADSLVGESKESEEQFMREDG